MSTEFGKHKISDEEARRVVTEQSAALLAATAVKQPSKTANDFSLPPEKKPHFFLKFFAFNSSKNVPCASPPVDPNLKPVKRPK